MADAIAPADGDAESLRTFNEGQSRFDPGARWVLGILCAIVVMAAISDLTSWMVGLASVLAGGAGIVFLFRLGKRKASRVPADVGRAPSGTDADGEADSGSGTGGNGNDDGSWLSKSENAISKAIGYVVVLWGLFYITLHATSWAWPPGRLLVVVALSVLTLLLVFSLNLPESLQLLSDSHHSLVRPFQVALVVAILGAGAFASITNIVLLSSDELMTNSEGHVVRAVPGRLMDFYLWNLVNALPGRPLETMKYAAPYDYSSHWIGLLVLAYSVLVVLPLLRYARQVWKLRGDRIDAAASSVALRRQAQKSERMHRKPSAQTLADR